MLGRHPGAHRRPARQGAGERRRTYGSWASTTAMGPISRYWLIPAGFPCGSVPLSRVRPTTSSQPGPMGCLPCTRHPPMACRPWPTRATQVPGLGSRYRSEAGPSPMGTPGGVTISSPACEPRRAGQRPTQSQTQPLVRKPQCAILATHRQVDPGQGVLPAGGLSPGWPLRLMGWTAVPSVRGQALSSC